MQAQIIQTSRFDFQRIYVKAAPSKTTQAQPEKAKTVKAKTSPQKNVAPDLRAFVAKAKEATEQKPQPLPIPPPIPTPPPLRKQAEPTPPAPTTQAAATNLPTAEKIKSDLGKLYAKKTTLAASYHATKSQKTLSQIEAIRAQIKSLEFLRSKVAPIPTLPKIKTVNFHDKETGDICAHFTGNDAQIFKHLKEANQAQRVASKAGKPFEGLTVTITHGEA